MLQLWQKLKMARKILTAKNYSLSDFEKDFNRFFYGGKSSTSGVNINEDTAMRFSAVFACVRVLSETIAAMPIKVYKRRPNGGRDIAYNHPLYRILHDEPNEEMTAFKLQETMQSHLVLSGNAYAYKEIDGRGRVKSLKLLNWENIMPERNKKTGKIEYIFDDNGNKITLNYDEIFHISGLGFDGIKGYSPITLAMDAVGLGMAAEQFASYFYSNGANVGGFIELPQAVKDKEELKNEFTQKFTGLGKSHKVIFLENGMKFQKLVMPLNEAQFIETRKFQIQEIARIYRMPLHLIQDLERATFSNIEHQDLGFIKHTMFPWVVRWEQEINHRLFTSFERQQGYYAEFSMDALLRGDAKSRAEVLHIKRQDGIINANEWRELDNQNPQPDELGDTYFINSTMIPVQLAALGNQSTQKLQEGGPQDEKKVLGDKEPNRDDSRSDDLRND